MIASSNNTRSVPTASWLPWSLGPWSVVRIPTSGTSWPPRALRQGDKGRGGGWPSKESLEAYRVMPLAMTYLLTVTAGLRLVAAAAQPSLSRSDFSWSDVIERDICIVGGGSSGTYATIQLRDQNLSTVLIEKEDHLGGHVETYTDPSTGEHLDFGVVAYTNSSLVRNYFDRLGVPYRSFNYLDLWPIAASKEVDFQTGENVEINSTVNETAVWAAYGKALDSYPYLTEGFELPDPVPADLLLSFDDWTKKYQLQDVVRLAYSFAQGYGNLLAQTTLYILKLLGKNFLETQAQGSIAAAGKNNRALYINATRELGEDVLLNSSVLASSRNATGVRLHVQTPAGPKLIVARKLIIAFPPTLTNLQGFDLTADERSVFSQLNNSGYYTALVSNTGIAGNLSLDNYDPNAPHGLPAMPAIYAVLPTKLQGVNNVFYGALDSSTADEVKADMISSIGRLDPAASEASPSNSKPGGEPTFVQFRGHVPFALTVPPELIASGFYRKMSLLQGQQATWWTGAAWHTQDSTLLWNWTALNLIPRVLQSIQT